MSAPDLRIVRGEPSAEEIAAITAVVSLVAADPATEGAGAPAKPAPGRWNDPAYAHRRLWAVGPGGWRAAR